MDDKPGTDERPPHHDEESLPLHAETLARDEWRGGGTSVAPEDSGAHTLPASEDDDERMKSGREGSAGPATIAPPD